MTAQIVLGLGGTVDFEIAWDSSVFEGLIRDWNIRAEEIDINVPMVDERSLVVAILGFFQLGVGGERFISSSDAVHSFAQRFRKKVTLGGTGLRAGIAMASLGVSSVQHLVSIDDTVRGLLLPAQRYITSSNADTLDPHLIVQFSQGARICAGNVDIVVPQANRVIVSDDLPNRTLLLSKQLAQELSGANAFLISGFNTMRNAGLLEKRLAELREAMRALPATAMVFYEDAGFYRSEFRARVSAALLDRISVYSMNEDELQDCLGRDINLLDPDAVAAGIIEAHRRMPVLLFVVHSRHWALATGIEAENYRNALAGGVQMASTRYRLGDGHSADDYRATAAFEPQPEASVFAAEIEQRMPGAVCIPAYRIEIDRVTTVGLGDSFVGGFLAAWSKSERTAS